MAMINIALNYQNALAKLIREIRELEHAVRYQDRTLEHAFNIIVSKADELTLLDNGKATIETLVAEHVHFLKNNRRNTRIKLKLRERRRAEGKPERLQQVSGPMQYLEMPHQSTAPSSMLPSRQAMPVPEIKMPSAEAILNSTDPRMREALKTAENMLAAKLTPAEREAKARLDAEDSAMPVFDSNAEESNAEGKD